MKEATFTLAILAAVVAIRYVWLRLATGLAIRIGVVRVHSTAGSADAVFSRAPLPRFDAAAAAAVEPGDFHLPLHTGPLPVLQSFPAHLPQHGPLRTSLLRLASRFSGSAHKTGAVYTGGDVRLRTRKTPLPRTGAGESPCSWPGLSGCMA